MTFFDSMEALEKAFWFIALPASLIFIVQTIMTFIGADSTDGTNPDFDGDFDGSDMPFQLFSLRNLINFLLGFSWFGISFYKSIPNHVLLIVISFFVGAGFVFLFFQIIKVVLKLGEDNTFSLNQALNKTGTVYLKIPAKRQSFGKIQVSVNGTVHELNAITDNEELTTGSMIKVLEIVDDNLVLVQSL